MEPTQQVLIEQSLTHVSCVPDQIPVLNLSALGEDGVVGIAVNFLRAGCPRVQVVIEAYRSEKFAQEAQELFSELELPRECFVIEQGKKIITITRK